jgi:DNA-binding GntR family transcriptional regulator
VYAAIRDAIVRKELAPGERVTEAGIAKRMDVSKTPVREAMLRLEEVGLIEPDGIRGSRVVQPSPAAFTQAFEVREVLEGYLAEKAATRADGTQAERIAGAAQRSLEAAQAGDQAGFREADQAFHKAIAEAAANPRLSKVIDDAADLLSAIRARDFPYTSAMVPCGEAHVAIAGAIRDHDTAAAAERMRAHIRHVQECFAPADDAAA